MGFKTTHKLEFEACPYEMNIDPKVPWQRFRIGTCTGLYHFGKESIQILAVENTEKGNGHFEDVFEWFEFSCKRHKLKFEFLELMNMKLRKHLIEKRGFQVSERDNLIKTVK